MLIVESASLIFVKVIDQKLFCIVHHKNTNDKRSEIDTHSTMGGLVTKKRSTKNLIKKVNLSDIKRFYIDFTAFSWLVNIE